MTKISIISDRQKKEFKDLSFGSVFRCKNDKFYIKITNRDDFNCYNLFEKCFQNIDDYTKVNEFTLSLTIFNMELDLLDPMETEIHLNDIFVYNSEFWIITHVSLKHLELINLTSGNYAKFDCHIPIRRIRNCDMILQEIE